MASFFEKLKKGMGIDGVEESQIQEAEEETVQQKAELKIKDKTPKSPAQKKTAVKKIKIESEVIEPEAKQPEKEELKKTEPPKPESKKDESAEDKRRSFNLQNLAGEEEGQLAVDVYQTNTELVIRSTIAGVKPEDLDISIEADTVLIRGNRIQSAESGEKNYFYQECYWGPFSRQIIIPEETDPSRAEANMKEGVLSIRIPKIERKKKRKIAVKS
jgi:HSP20 family molecular chaperone IbpA